MAEPNHAQQVDWSLLKEIGLGFLGLLGVFGLTKDKWPKVATWIIKKLETDSVKRERAVTLVRKQERADRDKVVQLLEDQVEQLRQERKEDRALMSELLLQVGINAENIDKIDRKADSAVKKASISATLANPEAIINLAKRAKEEGV
jgi:hypothetical protein